MGKTATRRWPRIVRKTGVGHYLQPRTVAENEKIRPETRTDIMVHGTCRSPEIVYEKIPDTLDVMCINGNVVYSHTSCYTLTDDCGPGTAVCPILRRPVPGWNGCLDNYLPQSTAILITPSALSSKRRYASPIRLNGKRWVMSGVVSILPSSRRRRISAQSQPSTPPVLKVRFFRTFPAKAATAVCHKARQP